MYRYWKEENSDILNLPSLSYFKYLRPKECVFAGDPGTHNICVCAQLENVKLKIFALKTKFNYRDFILKTVCSIENEDCMMHRCKNYPGLTQLSKLLGEQVINMNNKIEYKTRSNKSSNTKSTAMALVTMK